jgi:hypothetical protein
MKWKNLLLAACVALAAFGCAVDTDDDADMPDIHIDNDEPAYTPPESDTDIDVDVESPPADDPDVEIDAEIDTDPDTP